jgi:uncharacterized protein (TIGR02452 family)
METCKITEADLPDDYGVVQSETIRGDMFEIGAELASQGYDVALLNFANNDSYCANLPDSETQEAQLRRLSGLELGSEHEAKALYPIDKRIDRLTHFEYQELALLYTKKVPIMGQAIDIISCAAIEFPRTRNSGQEYLNKSDVDIMYRKMKMILSVAYDHDYIILGRWGLGAFYNPERAIWRLWGQALAQEGTSSGLKAIFCIK